MSEKNNSTKVTADQQVAKIFEWRRGFNVVYLINIGLELGLFKYLERNPNSTPDNIATSLSLHAPFIDVWCKTAFAVGILGSDDCVQYHLEDHFDQLLAKESHPRYLGGYIQLGTNFAAQDFKFCIEAFKGGDISPFQNRSDIFADTIGVAISGLHMLTSKKLLPELPNMEEKLKNSSKILDIGCGTGRLVFQIAKHWPNASVVGVDIDSTGIKIARARSKELGLENRVDLILGDIGKAGNAASFDVVTLVEVLHEISPSIRQKAVSDCYKLLKPGGWILIVDETYPSKPHEFKMPEYQFPVQTAFEELTWGNVIPTKEIQENLLRTAGFDGRISRKIIGEGFTILETQK